MRNPAHTTFGAIFQTEVLLNSKRVAPYLMALLFGGNAFLWWGWGPAESRGLAVNSEGFIAGMLPVFSFMTLPLFTALIMCDPVIRDFRTGIAPLIFSKPVSRAAYLLGKFTGNFFVLVCCQMVFPLTFMLLQGFRRPNMIVQPVSVLPYFKHFLLLVVISHLALAAFHFTVGTLTRNAKIVYGLAASFYPLYITYQVVLLKKLPPRWRSFLDPLLMNFLNVHSQERSAEQLNQLAVSYSADAIANRALMILIAAVCLAILYVRFSMNESDDERQITTVNLAASADWLDAGAESFSFAQAIRTEELTRGNAVVIPKVGATTEGVRAHLKQLVAALGIELRLLAAERSLVVLVPLATLLCVVGMAAYEAVPDGSYTAVYATRTAESLLLFLVAIAVFYTGEAMHRDRELRVEPVLWSAPAPNFVMLLSKFSATLLLSICFSLLVCLTAIALQLIRGHTPLEISAYLTTYSLVLLPSMVFLIAAATALNVLLRDKYLAYAVSFAIGIGLFYLYNQGYNDRLYNPVLYGLWTPSDLTGEAGSLSQLITHRIYCLAVATLFFSLANLFFERKATKGLRSNGRLSSTGWAILIMLLSTVIALIAGLMINIRM
ncbi:MAG TPA: ABC transporter permease [Pyrinomonadaceae bacterium]|nr:ABC transporter permease [Pyrinomonadaceae bacterium]